MLRLPIASPGGPCRLTGVSLALPSRPNSRASLQCSSLPCAAARYAALVPPCHVLRLAHGYGRAVGARPPSDRAWARAARAIVTTMRDQQRRHDAGPYHFQRATETPTDTLMLGGYG